MSDAISIKCRNHRYYTADDLEREIAEYKARKEKEVLESIELVSLLIQSIESETK